MDHFQPAAVTGADLAETAQPRVRLAKPLPLGGAEMKKAQGQNARAVAQPTEQATPAARRHLAAGHHRFNLRLHAGLQLADGGNAATVLITQRQVKQHIGGGMQAQSPQALGQLRSDALQCGDRQGFDQCRPRRVSHG